jgi:hypothetical protein
MLLQELEEQHPARTRKRRRSSGRKRRCPYCKSDQVQRSHAKGFYEVLVLPLFLRRPFKCIRCLKRHYAFSSGRRTLLRALSSAGVFALAVAVLLVLWNLAGRFL